MTQQETATARRSSSRKYLILASVILLIFAGWSAFWYVSYTKTQQLIDRLMARQVNGSPLLSCQDQKLGGYPFRLHLTCSAYHVTDPRSGWQIEGGPLRAIWQVYAPNLAVIESEASLRLNHDMSGLSFTMSSELIRGSVRFSPTDFVARASIEANMPTIASNNPSIAEKLGEISAEKIAFHARPTPDTQNDLDLSIAATDFTTGQTPLISGQLSFTAREGLSAAIRNQGNPARTWLQQSGKIDAINGLLEIGQKTLKLNGDVAFDQTGRANGELKLKILNPAIENADVARTLTAKRDGFNGPLTALQLMGTPVKDGDMIGSEVKIKLTSGQIRAGLLPLGTLPPLL